jgi:hypothetical protein
VEFGQRTRLLSCRLRRFYPKYSADPVTRQEPPPIGLSAVPIDQSGLARS